MEKAFASRSRTGRRGNEDRSRHSLHRESPQDRNQCENPCATDSSAEHNGRVCRQLQGCRLGSRYRYCSSLNKMFPDSRLEESYSAVRPHLLRHFQIPLYAPLQKTPYMLLLAGSPPHWPPTQTPAVLRQIQST